MQAPFTLHLDRWCETCLEPEGGGVNAGSQSLPSSPVSSGGFGSQHQPKAKRTAKYDLFAIVFHTGHTANSGHYVCATVAGPRSPPPHQPQPSSTGAGAGAGGAGAGGAGAGGAGAGAGVGMAAEWLMFDDTMVKRMSTATIQKMLAPDCRSASTAYMLFYSRRI